MENLNIIGLRDVEDLNGLKLSELVLPAVKLVDVGATKELSNDYQDMVVYQNRLAANNRLSCEDKKDEWKYNTDNLVKVHHSFTIK